MRLSIHRALFSSQGVERQQMQLRVSGLHPALPGRIRLQHFDLQVRVSPHPLPAEFLLQP